EVLESMSRKREISVSLQVRGRVVDLYYHKGKRKFEIEKEVSLSMMSILKWLSRWLSEEESRKKWYLWYKEEEITLNEYRELLLSLLKDKPRSGKPKKFTDMEIEKIVALAVTDPTSLGLPFSRWSESLLKVELINRKIVESISTAQIGRFLKRTQNQTPQE
ncbi:MAG: helix-turn-helix domain-containing protein, partial [Saprospiraceae bacterium]